MLSLGTPFQLKKWVLVGVAQISAVSAIILFFGSSANAGSLNELRPLGLNSKAVMVTQRMAQNQSQNQEPLVQQEPDEEEGFAGETVLTRERPELDPLGITVGSYLLFPKLAVDETYTSNLFFTENGTSDDFVTVIKPSLVLNSDWNNHSVNFTADATVGKHVRFDAENYEDFHAAVDGQFDIVNDEHFIFGDLEFFKMHEGRGSPDDSVGSAPTEFTLSQGILQYFLKLNRLSFTVDGSHSIYNYDDTKTTGTAINQDDRDRNESRMGLKVSYEFVPEVEAYLRVAPNKISYDDQVDDSGFDRDSHGLEIVGGSQFDVAGGTIFGNVFAGGVIQRYGDANLKRVIKPIIGGNVDWNVTTLTTLNANVSQRVEETTTGNASGYLASSYGVRADHELLRNLLINANLGLSNNNYVGVNRTDNVYQLGVGTKYMLARNFYLSANYNYSQRESDDGEGGDSDYKQHNVILRLELQM